MQPAIPRPPSLQSHTDTGGADYQSSYNTAAQAQTYYSPQHFLPTLLSHQQHQHPDDDDDSSLMDPSQAEFHTFHPYSPQEVKHRKRTTASQLKVLEQIFANDTTKPNSTLRTKLAAKLDMTPRSVQVWFQNRRAKQKMQAGRDRASGKTAAVAAAAADKRSPDLRVDSQQTASHSVIHRPPPGPPPPHLRVDTDSISSSSPPSSSWAGSPPLASNDSSTYLSLPEHSHQFLRRGSLPANVFSHENHMDPYARHGSVDASLHRLGQGPYAGSALARNVFNNNLRQSIPNMGVSPSSPFAAHQLTRHASVDALMMSSNPRGPLSRQMHAPLRPVYEPVPGPLPNTDYTFGAPSSDMSPPSLAGASPESEDDGTSYDTSTRFGSFASFVSSSSYGQSESNYQSPLGLSDAGAYTPSSAIVGNASASAPDISAISGSELQPYAHDVNAPSYSRSHSMPVSYGGHVGSAHETGCPSDGSLSAQYYASPEAIHQSYVQPTMSPGFAGAGDAGTAMHGSSPSLHLTYPSEHDQGQHYETGDQYHDQVAHVQHQQAQHVHNLEDFANYQAGGHMGGQALFAYT